MTKRILISADGSENSVRAAQQAAELACLYDGPTVEVASVIAVDVYSDMVYDPIAAHGEAQKKTIKPVINALEEAGVVFNIVLLHGRPADEILRYADENDVDLLVIGSRGLNALQQVAIGSVSNKVIKHAKCPVLVVK